ncbi:MAG: Hsp20/alpha crystallin family protein [Candidatus Promineifilaceae bacterium]|nr:Hsp20/alpha crystallin family protein [Candidatus Promineifilaceae bacterium]
MFFRYGNRNLWPSSTIWRDLRRLQREMDHLLGGTRGPIRNVYPAMNIWVSDEGVIATSEIPGVDPDDLDITVVGETLTLSGTRQPEEMAQDVKYHRRERGYGDFSRTFELPFRVDPDQVEARFRNGVLHIMLPRLAADKPKKISVSSA